MQNRSATIKRETVETRIEISLDLDGTGKCDIATGIPFFEHMLDQVARHGVVDLTIRAEGDLEIDAHHTVEDVGIVLGSAVAEALGRQERHRALRARLRSARRGAQPGGPGLLGPARRLWYRVDFPRPRIGDFDVDLVREFFQGFANSARATLHVDNLEGRNAHHVAETMFKAFGRALRMAVARDERRAGAIPSTKGVL